MPSSARSSRAVPRSPANTRSRRLVTATWRAHRRLEATACDPELADLARRCLDSDPARRPPDGQAVAAEADLGEAFDSRLLDSTLLYLRATNALNMDRAKEAVEMYQQALTVMEPHRETHPNDPKFLRRLGDTHLALAQGLPDTAGGRRHLRQALAYFERLLELNPLDPGRRRDVAHCHMALSGTNHAARVPPEEALAEAELGRSLAAKLHVDYPAVPEFQRVLAFCRYYAGRHYLMLNRPADARTAFEAARDHFQQLNEGGDGAYLPQFALARMFLAGLDLNDGRPDAALQAYRQAERDMEEVNRKAPNNFQQAMLAVIARRIALVYLAADRVDQAADEARRARNLLKPVLANLSHYQILGVELAACHATLSGLAGKPGSGVPAADKQPEADEAMKLLNTNTSDYYPHPRLLTGDPAFDSLRDRPDFQKFIRDGEAIVEKARKQNAR